MLFNSIPFLVFLPVVFLLYWFVFNKKLKAQNFFLVVVSYIFYGWWDWRFLFLIAFSSILDFYIGQHLQKSSDSRQRKIYLWLSVSVNLGFLGFFKYFNFFTENFALLLESMGFQPNIHSLNVILPVGISFYTFQTLSYTIDVYRKNLEPTKDILEFLAYVSFFPQLVAGPIERATNLLPQFRKSRTFHYGMAKSGLQQIIWGFFKKMVIADNCALVLNRVFETPDDYNGIVLVYAAILFAFQIYGDFSGYSDIAIGTAKLFGFKLMRNFSYPYFSRDIAEFWRRWHISLSTWFRDYLYIPLGGSRGGTLKRIRNTFLIFLISGFWHGANWTFVFWGFLNALYFLPLLLARRNRNHIEIVGNDSVFPNYKEVFQILTTFMLTCLAWIFFRAESMQYAFSFFSKMIDLSGHYFTPILPFTLVFCMLSVEWLARRKENVFDIKLPLFLKRLSYFVVIISIILFGVNSSQSFIYFQF